MNLVLDLFVGFYLSQVLSQKKYIDGNLSRCLIVFLFIIIKAVLLGIILWLFNQYFTDNIIWGSIIINLLCLGFMLFQKGSPWLKGVFKFKIGWQECILGIVLLIFGILIYNTIPFWWDELMYHMPISIELLQKGGWKNDLGLSFYWHNNIWQRYPKNLYFVIDYFYSHIHTIVGIQLSGIFSFLFFLTALCRLISFLYRNSEIKNKILLYLTLLLCITTPVVFLHFFVKWDTLLMWLLLLFIYVLLSSCNLYILSILFALIMGFKIMGIFYIGVIWIAYLMYLMFLWKKQFFLFFEKVLNIKFLLFSLVISIIWLYSYIFNYIKFDNFLYPMNIIRVDDTVVKEGTLKFSLTYYLKDFIFNSMSNGDAMKKLESTLIDDWIFNYDRGLWWMWFFMLLGVCLFFFLKERRSKISIFTITLFFSFFLLSLTKTSILFGHRYQIFIYVMLIWLAVYFLYQIFKQKVYYFLWFLIIINCFSVYKNVGIYAREGSGSEQLKYLTTHNYCHKLGYLWDLTRDYYVRGREYLCNNTSNAKILLVNQVFNFYTYGKFFNNVVSNFVFQNKTDFSNFLEKNSIDYIITSNKNNLYGKFGINENSIYMDTFSANDETLLFCSDQLKGEKIDHFSISYKINRPLDMEVVFGVNDLSETIALNGEKKTLLVKNKDISNMCFSLFDNPKKRFDNELKKVEDIEIIAKTLSGENKRVVVSNFRFQNYAIEDIRLDELWYKKVFVDNFADSDYMYIWKRE